MRYQCEQQGCTALFDSPDELASPVYCGDHRAQETAGLNPAQRQDEATIKRAEERASLDKPVDFNLEDAQAEDEQRRAIPRAEPMSSHMKSEVERQKEIREKMDAADRINQQVAKEDAQRQDAARGAVHVASGTFLTIAVPDALVTAMENLIEEGIYGSSGNEVAVYLIQRQLDELRRAGILAPPIGERDDEAFGPMPMPGTAIGGAALVELEIAEKLVLDDLNVRTFGRYARAVNAVTGGLR